MSRSSKVTSMKTIHFFRDDKENFLFSCHIFPIYHDSYSIGDLKIKYLEHSHAFWPRKENIVLNITWFILISRYI